MEETESTWRKVLGLSPALVTGGSLCSGIRAVLLVCPPSCTVPWGVCWADLSLPSLLPLCVGGHCTRGRGGGCYVPATSVRVCVCGGGGGTNALGEGVCVGGGGGGVRIC